MRSHITYVLLTNKSGQTQPETWAAALFLAINDFNMYVNWTHIYTSICQGEKDADNWSDNQ